MQMCLLMSIFIYVCTVSIFLNMLVLHLHPLTEHFEHSVIRANIQKHHLHKGRFGIRKRIRCIKILFHHHHHHSVLMWTVNREGCFI